MHKNSSPLCEMQDIEKGFVLPHGQTLPVLEKVSFAVPAEKIVAIIGPSGCGKSTLLRILAGLETPSSGKVFFQGKEQQGLLPEMTMVFQSFALYPWMTVRENIEVVLKARGLSDGEIKEKTHGILSLIGLVEFEEAYPKEISGGMKQRVGIARALVCDPTVLLMDEPFSALDSFTAESLRAEVLAIWAEKGRALSSIVLISHDIQEVVEMADTILVMKPNPGRIALVIENTLPRPRDRLSPEFLRLVEDLHHTYAVEPAVQAPAKELIGPLLLVGIDEIFGLLSYVKHKAGSEDLYQLGARSAQPFYKTINVVQAAELLNFVHIAHRTVSLTEIGKTILASSNKKRRLLWKEQLLTIPLFAHVYRLLQKPGSLLSKQDLLQFFAEKLPHQDANLQYKVFLRWSIYGYLFSYNRKTKLFSLQDPKNK